MADGKHREESRRRRSQLWLCVVFDAAETVFLDLSNCNVVTEVYFPTNLMSAFDCLLHQNVSIHSKN